MEKGSINNSSNSHNNRIILGLVCQKNYNNINSKCKVKLDNLKMEKNSEKYLTKIRILLTS